jgi:hypothetical protein
MSETITEVKKSGEWYQVTGVSDGKKVSYEISAKDIDGRSQRDGLKRFAQSLKTAAAQEG